ncbi:MAG: hypothetical protein GF313_04310 [Caldithrix sp.]|nr:hypothetical protein [Caldithrix sp.]
MGLKNTQVYFPISKDIAVPGEIDKVDNIAEGTVELIAALDTKIIMQTYKQICTPTLNFKFMDKRDKILEGNQLLNHIGA